MPPRSLPGSPIPGRNRQEKERGRRSAPAVSPQHGTASEDRRAIDELVRAFFGLFSNRGGVRPNLRAIFDLCISEAIISKCVSATPEVMSLEAFIAPREVLLSNGT